VSDNNALLDVLLLSKWCPNCKVAKAFEVCCVCLLVDAHSSWLYFDPFRLDSFWQSSVDVVCLMTVSSWGLWVRQFSEQVNLHWWAVLEKIYFFDYKHLGALKQWLTCYQVALTEEFLLTKAVNPLGDLVLHVMGDE
jgi:hypothetical protein